MRCLVIEDEAETAAYIVQRLGEAGHQSILADNGAEGLRLARDEAFDVVILDRLLPGGMDGLAMLQAFRAAGRRTPVLILSALSSLDERVRGLREGGDDYLTKPFAIQELLARIEALVRRAAMRDGAEELVVADLVLDVRTHKAYRGGKPLALQPREFRLLEFLVRHKGQVVTRAMLLEAVWGFQFDPETGVIDVQISRLRQKIDRDFGLPLLHTVRGIGYRLDADGVG